MFLAQGGRGVLVDVGHMGASIDKIADTPEGVRVVVLIVAGGSEAP